jgi:hypothetical protein
VALAKRDVVAWQLECSMRGCGRPSRGPLVDNCDSVKQELLENEL